jgi:hypothetical protein
MRCGRYVALLHWVIRRGNVSTLCGDGFVWLYRLSHAFNSKVSTATAVTFNAECKTATACHTNSIHLESCLSCYWLCLCLHQMWSSSPFISLFSTILIYCYCNKHGFTRQSLAVVSQHPTAHCHGDTVQLGWAEALHNKLACEAVWVAKRLACAVPATRLYVAKGLKLENKLGACLAYMTAVEHVDTINNDCFYTAQRTRLLLLRSCMSHKHLWKQQWSTFSFPHV